VRNRIRRRLRAALAALSGSESRSSGRLADPLRAGAAYLVSAEADAASCPYVTLRAWVEGAVRQAHERTEARP
jgi:hypothetical protein